MAIEVGPLYSARQFYQLPRCATGSAERLVSIKIERSSEEIAYLDG